MRSPLLGYLTALHHLTRLHVGGCDITDSDITQHIAAFSALQDLDLWGCTAGGTSAHHLATGILPNLSKLSMAWSQVSSALPLLPGLTYLDLSHCKLGGSFSDGEFVAAAEMQQLRVVLLVQAEVDAMGCELLETLLRWVPSYTGFCTTIRLSSTLCQSVAVMVICSCSKQSPHIGTVCVWTH